MARTFRVILGTGAAQKERAVEIELESLAGSAALGGALRATATVAGQARTLEVCRLEGGLLLVRDPAGDRVVTVEIDGVTPELVATLGDLSLPAKVEGQKRKVPAGIAAREAPSGPTAVAAPMPGRVVKVLVAKGAAIKAGQGLVVVEAMKMENEVRAPRDGVVDDVLVREGQAVEAQEPLVRLA